MGAQCREVGAEDGNSSRGWFDARLPPPLRGRDLQRHRGRDEKRGAKIVFNSLAAPVCQIAKNCGIEGQIVLSKVIDKDFGYGFNAANFEYGDLFDAGVVDSAQVTLSALENSASIAGLVLTTEALIHEIPQDLSEDEKLAAMDAAAGMGGMDYM